MYSAPIRTEKTVFGSSPVPYIKIGRKRYNFYQKTFLGSCFNWKIYFWLKIITQKYFQFEKFSEKMASVPFFDPKTGTETDFLNKMFFLYGF